MKDVDLDSDSLVCRESFVFLNEEEVVDEGIFYSLENCSTSEDEYVDLLLEDEISFRFKRDPSLILTNWVKSARLESITWIFKARAVFGFRLQTAYLSMVYFDHFLSRYSMNNKEMWKIRLLSVGCLSLAAKMEELSAPLLSHYQIQGYEFQSEAVERMELFVLSMLDWKMGAITPFAFIHYFVKKLCNESSPNTIVCKTVEILCSVIREINLAYRQASVMAVASILVAMDNDHKLTREEFESKVNPILHHRLLQTEDVLSCYNLIWEIKVERHKKEQSPTNTWPGGVEDSLVSETGSSKRKRLTFN